MVTKKIGSGTTINVKIPLSKSINDYENIFISLYTDKKNPVKFSYVETTGYNKLDIGSSETELVGVLTSVQTEKFYGLMCMEMKAISESTPDENIGNSIPTSTGIEFISNTLSN